MSNKMSLKRVRLKLIKVEVKEFKKRKLKEKQWLRMLMHRLPHPPKRKFNYNRTSNQFKILSKLSLQKKYKKGQKISKYQKLK